MLDKKKLHFFQLSFVFGAIVITALLSNWSYTDKSQESMTMMGQNMGNMMASMHLKNINIRDLFYQEESMDMMQGMQSHHNNQSGFLIISHYLTTGTIIILLPFIIAGSVFLAILWIK